MLVYDRDVGLGFKHDTPDHIIQVLLESESTIFSLYNSFVHVSSTSNYNFSLVEPGADHKPVVDLSDYTKGRVDGSNALLGPSYYT